MEKLVVINALAKKFYDDCHIRGSINVPLDMIEDYAQKIDKKTPLVVYCASYNCPVSQKAWHIFNGLGFKSVWAYEGGIAEWSQKGYPCAGACKEEYLNRQEQSRQTGIATISAEALKQKMEEAGLF